MISLRIEQLEQEIKTIEHAREGKILASMGIGPIQVAHCFRYVGESGVGRLIIMYTPAGIERAFLQHDEWAANGTDVTPEMFKNLADNIGAYPLQDLAEYLSKNS